MVCPSDFTITLIRMPHKIQLARYAVRYMYMYRDLFPLGLLWSFSRRELKLLLHGEENVLEC